MPRENRTDSIEIYNTGDGRGNGFVNIHMPVEAARELLFCFEEKATYNPAVAEKLQECIEATEVHRNYQAFIEKGYPSGE